MLCNPPCDETSSDQCQPMPALKNAKHEAFAVAIFEGKTQRAAYELAGYQKRDCNASRLKSSDKVKNRIAELHKEVADLACIDRSRVVAEYAKVAFANMEDYVSFTNKGEAYLDFSLMDRDKAAAISEVVIDEYVDGKGEDGRDVKKTKFKLHNKLGALDSIARHLGMFIDKSQIDVKHYSGGIFDEAVKQAEQVRAGQAIESAPMVTVGSNGHANGANGHGSNGTNGVDVGPVIECDFEEIE